MKVRVDRKAIVREKKKTKKREKENGGISTGKQKGGRKKSTNKQETRSGLRINDRACNFRLDLLTNRLQFSRQDGKTGRTKERRPTSLLS